MTRVFSTYLDAVRFGAAFLVLLAHASQPYLTGLNFGILAHFGHDAVVMFFVLSGCVIAYTVEARDRDIRTYAANRLARLWSVAWPALLLTALADAAVSAIAPGRYTLYPYDEAPLRLAVNAFFLNQIWFLDLAPFSKSPFWSLGFEFWYYALFAAWCYCRGKQRIFALVGLALGVGPKILLLLPVWLLGVLVYRCRPHGSKLLGGALCIGSLAFYLLYRASPLSQALYLPSLIGLGPLAMASYFPSDYIVGLLFAVHLLGFRVIEDDLAPVLQCAAPSIRFAAGYTFSLYLLQLPLLQLIAVLLPGAGYAVLLPVLGAVIAIGAVTERKKTLARRALIGIADRLRALLKAARIGATATDVTPGVAAECKPALER